MNACKLNENIHVPEHPPKSVESDLAADRDRDRDRDNDKMSKMPGALVHIYRYTPVLAALAIMVGVALLKKR